MKIWNWKSEISGLLQNYNISAKEEKQSVELLIISLHKYCKEKNTHMKLMFGLWVLFCKLFFDEDMHYYMVDPHSKPQTWKKRTKKFVSASIPSTKMFLFLIRQKIWSLEC